MNENVKKIEWKKYTPLLMMLFVSLVFLIYTFFDYLSLTKSIRVDSQQLLSIKQKTAFAFDNEKRIIDHDIKFDQLKRQGYIGEPQRLKWLEVLQETVNHIELPQIRFTLFPTVNESDLKQDDYIQEKSNLSLTPMRLEMELMHERDFYDFITRYKSVAPGVFQVDECEIKRIEDNATTKPIQLLAVCQLTWFNYRDIREDWAGDV